MRGTCVALLALLQASAALAQGGAQVYTSFFLTARAPDIIATTVSQRVALGAAVPVAVVCNFGPDNVYVALGGVTVTASSSSSFLITVGQCARLSASASTNLAAVAAGDTGSTVQTMLGSGNP